MPVALQDLVFEILAEMDLEERYLSLKLESTAPLIVDPLLLRRVIWNLCSNIAKYTPNDCTVVIASRNIEGFVEIQISDTGEGVSDEALVRLLDPFWRIDNSRSRPKSSSNSSTHQASQGGWGVGLSFVQHAMEAHKGSVVLSHNQPSGLTVTLKVPIIG
jgi:signal transduction histidine kinase